MKEIFKIFIKNYFFLLFVLLLILILFHNFLITGCLVYPVSFTCFENNLWAIKANEVKELNNWYEQWAKGGAGPNFRVENPILFIQNFNWVPKWIDVYFFNKISDFLAGLLFLFLIVFFILRSNKKVFLKRRKINLLVICILILLFEWFYNHPALRYGGYCLIVSILFIYFSTYMEKFKINKNVLIKKINFLILITLVIFSYRNYKRINFETEFYNYKPLKNFYYHIDEKNFNLQNDLNYLISNYEICIRTNKNCKLSIDNNLYIKKKYGKYFFYKK